MKSEKAKKSVAVLGGGPSGLFVYKRLVDSNRTDLEIHIFEAKNTLGMGMPYSCEGASMEHITNVSDNEIPEIVTSIQEWVLTLDPQSREQFNIDPVRFNEYKVLPRLLFGKYLAAQFDLLLQNAANAGIETHVHFNSRVNDIVNKPGEKKVSVDIEGQGHFSFDHVIVCTGHKWLKTHEGIVPGYFDSPYPPSKLNLEINHPIAIKGSSLTAIDAIRTLARSNGKFFKLPDGKAAFEPASDRPDFKIVMHSRNGMLPAVRFHLEEPLLSSESLLTPEELDQNRAQNDGFLSLDYIFKKDFIALFKEKDHDFYEKVKDLSIEDFVGSMMKERERMEPFQLLRAEYAEAEKSIRNKESVYWKEILAVLSFAMNYPAKYLSAEDMLRLQKVLMPLISIVIAFVPQSSCEELLALNDAGRLEIISVGSDGEVEAEKNGGATYHYTDDNNEEQSQYYNTYIDCVGQPHLSFQDFPFKSLLEDKSISPARIKFRYAKNGIEMLKTDPGKVDLAQDGTYFLKVPGVTINDHFQIIDFSGQPNKRIYIMAVPYIGGYNPDYSGLDFCEEASESIVAGILQDAV